MPRCRDPRLLNFFTLIAVNYYNYFTEIEDAFIRRRGKHLFLSPMDWALIESWKERGVPLHVALRAIETVFDNQAARASRRSIKSLLYCQEEVEAQFAEWLETQLGATMTDGANGAETTNSASSFDETSATVDLPFPREVISAHLRNCRELLAHAEKRAAPAFAETVRRAASRLAELERDFARAAHPDVERLEASLSDLENLLDRELRAALSETDLERMRATVAAQLEPYRPRMTREMFELTFENMLAKRLREEHGIPRLSLFHL
jgi:hypothetical protein